jgi:hypothetical protein
VVRHVVDTLQFQCDAIHCSEGRAEKSSSSWVAGNRVGWVASPSSGTLCRANFTQGFEYLCLH